MLKENHIQISKTARYFSIGEASKKITKIIFAIHGFAQLAENFIKNFENLKSENSFIIAPEALNKFYVRGYRGTIGTTWLTKEDRENEITDYINFLDKTFSRIVENIDLSNCKIIVIGFSQGTHTACRWLAKSRIKINSLLLWGGAFPHDVNYKTDLEYWNNINHKIFIGNKDRFISEERIIEERNFIKSQKLKVDLNIFEGKHELNSNLLKEIIKKDDKV